MTTTTLGHAPPRELREPLEFGNPKQIQALRNLPQPCEPNEEGQILYRVEINVVGTIYKEVWASDPDEAEDIALEACDADEIEDPDYEVERVTRAFV